MKITNPYDARVRAQNQKCFFPLWSPEGALLKARNGVCCWEFRAESGGMASGCSLSSVHLRIFTLSVVKRGGLKHHMHRAHYLVFSGVEEEK